MLDKLLLGRYVKGNSWIHQLDPRTKLIGTFFFVMIVFLANNWLTYTLLSVFVWLALWASKIPLKFFWNGVKPLLWVILFTSVLQMLFTPEGTEYLQVFFLRITSLGILNAVYIFLRFVLIICMSTLMTLTTPPLQIADAMESVLSPLKRFGVPVHEISLMLSIALRFVPTLMDEAQQIMNAQRARGVEFGEGNLLEQMKAILPILIPLFVSSLNRALDLATAMEARGYQGAEGRSKYRILHYTQKDVVATIMFIFLTVLLLFFRRIV